MTELLKRHPRTRRFAIACRVRALLAITAALWLIPAQSQSQSTEAALQPTPVVQVSFREFFRHPVGPAGVEISETLRQVDGKKVRLSGYMVKHEVPTPGRFMLTPRPVQMSEHADGDADDLPAATVLVQLEPSQQEWVVPHVSGLIAVTGELHLGRVEDQAGRVSWVQVQLGGDAVRTMNAFELAGYLHQLQHRH